MIFLYALSLLVIAAMLVVLLWAIVAFRNHRAYRHLPGPPLSSYFLGNLPDLEKYRRETFLSRFMYDCHMKYGLTFK